MLEVRKKISDRILPSSADERYLINQQLKRTQMRGDENPIFFLARVEQLLTTCFVQLVLKNQT